MSVRKSHLQGRNHIKLYCNYYEQVLKQLGIYEEKMIGAEYVSRNAPGLEFGESEDLEMKLPPPPTLRMMPNPPPSVLNYDTDKQLVAYHQI